MASGSGLGDRRGGLPSFSTSGSCRDDFGRDMESTLKELRAEGESVMKPRCTVAGGVEDAYGEDRATEEQLVTPWTVSVARSRLSSLDLLPSLASPTFSFLFSCRIELGLLFDHTFLVMSMN